ncbi:hypothetical protein ABZ372_54600, partial [Streptomyces sp. NPDC005921]
MTEATRTPTAAARTYADGPLTTTDAPLTYTGAPLTYWDTRHRERDDLASGGHIGLDRPGNEIFYAVRCRRSAASPSRRAPGPCRRSRRGGRDPGGRPLPVRPDGKSAARGGFA